MEQTKKTQQENNGIFLKIELKHSLLGKHNEGGMRMERVKKRKKYYFSVKIELNLKTLPPCQSML